MDLLEIKGQFTDIMLISELRGAYPNVPIAADVDYDALIAGEADPQFITLPIAKVNAKSANGRFYDEAFVMELMRQTLANRPIGLMGHMTEAERATAFLPEAVHWIGAVRDGDLIWGKGLLVGAAKERVRKYKATGKSIATSIDAHADGKWDESLKAFRMDAASLRLSQIDLAPADRAGIADLARIPQITSEMQDEHSESLETPQEVIVDRLQVIQELTAADARLLPDAVRAAILEAVTPPTTPPEVAQVAELRTALGVDDKADLIKTVQELRHAEETRKQDEVKARIRELVEDTEKGVKVVALRGMITEMVRSRKPGTIAEVETIFADVVASDAVKTALAGHVQSTMGPRQGAGSVAGQTGKAKYFAVPEAA